MLKYLWTVTQDLFVVVTLVTWMHAVLGRLYGKQGRIIHGIGIVLGVACSIALAAVKGNSNKIISSHWKTRLKPATKRSDRRGAIMWTP